jgi:hypothetical protein
MNPSYSVGGLRTEPVVLNSTTNFVSIDLPTAPYAWVSIMILYMSRMELLAESHATDCGFAPRRRAPPKCPRHASKFVHLLQWEFTRDTYTARMQSHI